MKTIKIELRVNEVSGRDLLNVLDRLHWGKMTPSEIAATEQFRNGLCKAFGIDPERTMAG